MIYSNFTGRVAKKARVIDGVNGQFLSMDLAVNDFSKGEEATQWVRVQSSDPAVERTTYYHCEHCQECDTPKILLHNIMLH